jgi:hypothetical protein
MTGATFRKAHSRANGSARVVGGDECPNLQAAPSEQLQIAKEHAKAGACARKAAECCHGTALPPNRLHGCSGAQIKKGFNLLKRYELHKSRGLLCEEA